MAFFKSRSATFLLALVVLELVLVSYYVPQVEANKRKLMRKLKKIKDILPILLALKAKKKKILLLPLPIPMKGDMDMKMNMDWNMPMMQDPCPMQMSFPMMDCGGGDYGGAQSFGGGYGNNGGGGGGYGGNGGNGGNFRGGNGGNGGGY